jgi:hypothetical protein
VLLRAAALSLLLVLVAACQTPPPEPQTVDEAPPVPGHKPRLPAK